ncbi:hypothetical protein [Deinococcus misasensis]|uniref:hypothetical protein n=1 Tax=Deinococcus misasensis TaxID=392413 RepID=UPI000552BFC6|nr:hypothetical protein [Deinococcus misasensis]
MRGKFDPSFYISKNLGEEKAARIAEQSALFADVTVATPSKKRVLELGDIAQPLTIPQPSTSTLKSFKAVTRGRDDVRSEPPEPRLSVAETIRRTLDCPEYERLHLSAAQDRIYQSFLEIAMVHARAAGLSKAVTTVTFHIPAEFIMAHAGYKKTTFYDALKGLTAAGLVAVKGKTGDLKGKSRKTGSVCCVKLNPRHTHIWPKVRTEDLQHQYRDLNADVEAGKTAWKSLNTGIGESKDISEEVINTNLLVSNWTLSPSKLNQNSLSMTLRCASDADWDVFDLPTLRDARLAQRSALVSVMADGIAAKLRDHHSVNLYRHVLWQTLRLLDQGIDRLEYLMNCIQRMDIAQREGACRKNAGARLIDEWKRDGFWQELKDVPRYRVGKVEA